jgi:16S rRNA (cytosine967-C5)-methyltransferase
LAKAKFNHVEIKPIKNSRLIALEIWILIFYKYKKLDDIINNSYDFNRLDKRDRSFVYLILNTSMRRHKQIQFIYNKYSKFGIKKRNRYLNGILTLATTQLIWLKTAPYAVLNDAVNQARKFGGENQSKLVNGLLRNMLNNEEQWFKLIPNEKYNLPDWLF